MSLINKPKADVCSRCTRDSRSKSSAITNAFGNEQDYLERPQSLVFIRPMESPGSICVHRSLRVQLE